MSSAQQRVYSLHQRGKNMLKKQAEMHEKLEENQSFMEMNDFDQDDIQPPSKKPSLEEESASI